MVHLINATSSATLVFGAEKEGDAKEAQHSLKDEGKNLDLVQLFDVEKAWARNELPAPTDERDVFQTQVPYEQNQQEAAFTLHSSGSTASQTLCLFTRRLPARHRRLYALRRSMYRSSLSRFRLRRRLEAALTSTTSLHLL